MKVLKIFGIGSLSQSKLSISPEALRNTQKLLKMMNQSTKYAENAERTSFQSDILSTVKMGDKIKFTDNRIFLYPIQNLDGNVNLADCSLCIGKNRLDINSKTGEVIRHNTGIFTGLKNLIKKVEKITDLFIENFDNAEVVTKKTFKIQGFTKKGFERLQQHNK